MSKFRVTASRALVLSLATVAFPAFAQAPAAPAPATTLSEKSDVAAAKPATKSDEQLRQLQAALDKSDELMSAGKLDAATELLENTDRKLPGDALVAASLGAAFERKGEFDKALEWVREGVKRDASQHQASEWLHARMLEAQIALSKDPGWFERNRVLELDFGKDDVPTAPEILPIEQGRIKGAEQLLDQIGYQLARRTKFAKPPDAVVGDLFASAGDLAIAGALSPLDDRKSKLRPEQSYERALEYGAPHADLVRRRLAKYRADIAALPPAPKEEVAEYPVVSRRFETPPERAVSGWLYVAGAAAAAIALVLVGVIFDRRRRKRAEATPPPPLPEVD